MNFKNVILGLVLLLFTSATYASEKIKLNNNVNLLKSVAVADEQPEIAESEFTPSINVGAIIHMYAGSEQRGYTFGEAASDADNTEWVNGFTLYRSRIMLGAQLTKKANFFMETELSSSANSSNDDAGNKSIRIQPMVLDCQFEYVFMDEFSVVAGMQLVSHNRNGLQGAAGLLANDFTYFQYPNNMHPNSALQNNLGRDLGVNFRGLLLDDKLEYRLGFFSGRTDFTGETKSPLRTVGRLVYNVFDADKSYYYNGTNLGNGKTLSLGAGVDHQGTYTALGADVFADLPLGDAGSITANAAYSYITPGDDATEQYSFVGLMDEQTTQHLELGYYHKKSKLQPWIRYEQQDLMDLDTKTTVIGGGLNYWFNDYNTNVRASYTSAKAGDADAFGQVWLQVQVFLF